MSFASPELLLGLLIVPLALIGYLLIQRRRSRYAVRFTNVDLLANIAPRTPNWRRHLPPLLYLAAIAALAIGLARPSLVLAVPREEATIMLTMDVSRSMLATDVDPNRLGGRSEGRDRFRGPAAKAVQDRSGRVLHGRSTPRPADRRPCRDPPGACLADGRRRDRHG